jgi:hypothetical protein
MHVATTPNACGNFHSGTYDSFGWRDAGGEAMHRCIPTASVVSMLVAGAAFEAPGAGHIATAWRMVRGRQLIIR